METRIMAEPCIFTSDEVRQMLHESEERFAAGIFISEEEMENIF